MKIVAVIILLLLIYILINKLSKRENFTNLLNFDSINSNKKKELIEKKHIYEKLGNNTTNAYIINKKGIKKLLEYKYKKNKKLNLNIYNSNNQIFELNVNNNKYYDLINKIYYNVTLYFVEILFMLMIIITIGTVVYFVIKIK